MKKLLFIMVIIFSLTIVSPVWAQAPESFGEGVLENPISIFYPENRGFTFLMFLIGIAIYSIFVWYFYRFISKRDLFPKLFYQITQRKEDQSLSIPRIAAFIAAYVVAFPFVIFIWFTVLTFFVFFIGQDMPFDIAIFVSLAIIGVVRILSYYREDAAKEVGKLVPYAMLSFFLTSVAVYSDPNFFTEKNLETIPSLFVGKFENIVAAILLISSFEFSFRIAFIIKRKLLPAADKQLEDEIEQEIDERLKAHYKKIEDKEKALEKKLDEMKKKLDESA